MHRSARALAVPLLLCAALMNAQLASAQDGPLATPQTAQAPSASPESETANETDNTGDSPRSMLTRFFELTRKGDYADAAKFLEMSGPMDPERAPELAKRLRLVLDHYVVFDMNTVSPAHDGDTGDSLNAAVDEIARLPVGSSTAGVYVIRRKDDARWRFAKRTVSRIDGWYDGMPNRFWLGLTPTPLLNQGPWGLLWAQWCALPGFLALVWLAGIGLSRISRRILAPVLDRAGRPWWSELLHNAAGPLTTLFSLALARLLLPLLGLQPHANDYMGRLLLALSYATFFWTVARGIDAAGKIYARSQWGRGAPATRAIVLFTSRIGKSLVAVLAFVTLFSELGYPVSSLIAGLGIGGVALALSTQKSLENLIGAFSIAVDQPFREGDYVTVDGIAGTVEMIGMRSTRIRTQERTLVSLPNGKLADMKVETYAARDRIRLAFTFALVYGTTEAQLRQVIEKYEAFLRAHPKVWPEVVMVRFSSFGEYALMVDVWCWFMTTDYNEFCNYRQEALLGLMRIVEEVGTSLALPAQTLQLGDGVSRQMLENAKPVLPAPRAG